MLFTYISQFLIFCHICFKSLIFFLLVKPFENELQISCSFIIHFPGPRTSFMPLQYHHKIQETGLGCSTIISSAAHHHILLILPRVSFLAFPRQAWLPSESTSLLLPFVCSLTFHSERLLRLCFVLHNWIGPDSPRSRGWDRGSNAGRYLGGDSRKYD